MEVDAPNSGLQERRAAFAKRSMARNAEQFQSENKDTLFSLRVCGATPFYALPMHSMRAQFLSWLISCSRTASVSRMVWNAGGSSNIMMRMRS